MMEIDSVTQFLPSMYQASTRMASSTREEKEEQIQP